MSGLSTTVDWNEQQWNRVQQVVHDEAHKSRVAARFLPLYGPLPADAETVPAQRVSMYRPEEPYDDKRERLAVDDVAVLRLTSLGVNVYLNSQQVAQPDLSSAITLFRRAANIIARAEDAIIFRGQPEAGRGPEGLQGLPPVYSVSGGGHHRGLVHDGNHKVSIRASMDDPRLGQHLVRPITEAVADLESRGYLGPYAVALGTDLFSAIETPTESMVLPSDRIRPIIEGPLLRASVLDPGQGVVVALSGNPVEIVVARDIYVRFLQITAEPRYVFRVSERFVLRIKESEAIVTIAA